MTDRSARAPRGAVVLGAVVLSGCGLWRPVTVPIATIAVPARCSAPSDTLLVLLPGAASMPEEFVREGFVGALRERHVAADVVIADAHRGYYRQRSIIDRLQEDVIAPARARGYRQVWLVGISLGGFGAMIYTRERPAGVTGIVAIAPYLGEGEVANEIAAQGGLKAWDGRVTAGEGAEPLDTPLWRWLQPYANGARADDGAERPPLYLGYGRSDRFAVTNALLAAALPPEHVFTTDGGHDWPPWLRLWRSMLDVMPLARDVGCGLVE